MTAEQFTYWLQGFMEVANPTTLDVTQTQIIKDHLALVFDKQTPDRAPGIFDPKIPVPPKQWPTTDPYPLPKSPFTPIWETNPNIFRPICSTPNIYTSTGENPMEKIYCSHMVPQHMFGSKEEDTVGTDSLKIIKEEKRKFRGGVKC